MFPRYGIETCIVYTVIVFFCLCILIMWQRLNGVHDSNADDGGGMDPNSIRKCMSLGYSSKKSKTTIGQCN